MNWYWGCMATGLLCGLILGYQVCDLVHSKRALREAQQKDLERARRIHDTRRVSVARPGTTPGRVRKASINMDASNMGQRSEEV